MVPPAARVLPQTPYTVPSTRTNAAITSGEKEWRATDARLRRPTAEGRVHQEEELARASIFLTERCRKSDVPEVLRAPSASGCT
jgi:hypothetical protein